MKPYCETCGSNYGLTRSHFVKTNSVSSTRFDEYDYNSPDNWFTQCINCHMGYEKLSKQARVKYLTDRRLTKYANRAVYLITL